MAFPSILVLLAPPPYLSFCISLPLLSQVSFPPSVFLPCSSWYLCLTVHSAEIPSSLFPHSFLLLSWFLQVLQPHLKIWSEDPHMKEITRRLFFSSHITSLNILHSSLIHSWKEAQPSVPVHVLSCPELQTSTLAPSSSSSGLRCYRHSLTHPNKPFLSWTSPRQISLHGYPQLISSFPGLSLPCIIHYYIFLFWFSSTAKQF